MERKEEKKKHNPKKSENFVLLQRLRAAQALSSDQILTDEQYILYCIEIQHQTLGLYWYCMIFQNSAIAIPKKNKKKVRQYSVLFN